MIDGRQNEEFVRRTADGRAISKIYPVNSLEIAPKTHPGTSRAARPTAPFAPVGG
jgi:hypothetical protein